MRKSKKLSTQIDVFSYGVVLLEILTRQKPGRVPGTDRTVVLPELVKTAILEERTSDVLDLELLKPSMYTPTKNGLVEVKDTYQTKSINKNDISNQCSCLFIFLRKICSKENKIPCVPILFLGVDFKSLKVPLHERNS